MKISTQCDFLLNNYSASDTIRILADAGYDCIDISFFVAMRTIKEMTAEEVLKNNESAKALRELGESLGVSFNQAHAPFPSSVGDEQKDKEIYSKIVRSMELASIFGVKYIVVHPMHHLSYAENKDLLKEMNYEFYRSLIPYCEKFNIKIAIENMYQYDKKRECIVRSACADPNELIEYIDSLNSPWFVACLDLGHCALTGENIEEAIKSIGQGRLKALHVHDVDYKHDCHTLPGVEKLDYDAIARALAKVGYDGELTLEADNFFLGFDQDFAPEVASFMAKRARFLADKIVTYKNENN